MSEEEVEKEEEEEEKLCVTSLKEVSSSVHCSVIIILYCNYITCNYKHVHINIYVIY